MICHKWKVIFIHQRKCAGRSVVRSFKADGFKGDYLEGVLSPNWDERPKDYFVFAVARNPFDRLVSSWLRLAGELWVLSTRASVPGSRAYQLV